jgi:outer membrane protein OmpA-like peptidoglycan-associated protein
MITLLARIACVSIAFASSLAQTAEVKKQMPNWHNAPRIALEPGLVITQTRHRPEGDRESLVTVGEVTAEGVTYHWQYLDTQKSGELVSGEHTELDTAADLATATGWYEGPLGDGVSDHPGYTSYSLSTAVYEQLLSSGAAAFSIRSRDTPGGFGPALAQAGLPMRYVPVRWRGELIRVSAGPEPFPLIIDGERVVMPAQHLRGQFSARHRAPWNVEIWVLDDGAHPLLLKVTDESAVLQVVRIDRAAEPEATAFAELESELATTCRVELPGIYFAFNSSTILPASERTIATLADVLERHPDWRAAVEGHTDNIGTEVANEALSLRRAEAVRDRLVAVHGIPDERLTSTGYGESRPRESNATIEGRARNRRVELARDCKSSTAGA